MWQLIRPLDVSTSVNLARGGGGWCSAAREKLVNKVSWDRTERSVGKNCIKVKNAQRSKTVKVLSRGYVNESSDASTKARFQKSGSS
jgi:hypothetical protein